MVAPSLARELGAKLCGAAVLPDDGVGDRPARRPLPYDRGLALIGDADCRDRVRPDLAKHGAADMKHGPPDLLGIVLDLTRRRIDLRERHLRRGAGLALAVEQDGAGARRPLIDGQDEGLCAHLRSAPAVWSAIQPQYSALPPSVGSTSSAGSS